MRDPTFRAAWEAAKARMASGSVMVVRVADDMVLYVSEPLVARALGCSADTNSFRTH
jgi:hypothetical protein